MPCTVSDKETINGVARAKGIKSTHAQLLFKLIKAPSPFSTYTTKPADKEAGNGSDVFCLAGKSIADTLMRGGVVGFMRAAMLMISTTFAAPQCQSCHVVQGMHGGIFVFFNCMQFRVIHSYFHCAFFTNNFDLKLQVIQQ